jgi:hypothetical protein
MKFRIIETTDFLDRKIFKIEKYHWWWGWVDFRPYEDFANSFYKLDDAEKRIRAEAPQKKVIKYITL